MDLHDLAPRIKQLKFRQDDLSKTRVLTEVEMTAQGINYLDEKSVTGYCHNLVNLLEQSEISMGKALLRSFKKRIVIDKVKATIEYKVSLPPETKRIDTEEVLPIEPLGGAEGVRTPYLHTASVTFSQLNYGPIINLLHPQ